MRSAVALALTVSFLSITTLQACPSPRFKPRIDPPSKLASFREWLSWPQVERSQPDSIPLSVSISAS